MKVLFHIEESTKWPLTLQNAKNQPITATKKDDFQIEIVTNSQAVSELTKALQTFSDELVGPAERGVKTTACANVLCNLSIEPEQLHSFVRVVPVGAAELAEKQEKGYGYIKP